MERILNDDERIRRAEEIYYRRNNCIPVKNDKEKTCYSKSNLKNSFFFHLLIMINLVIIVISVQNKDFIFSQEFLSLLDNYNIEMSEKIKEFLKSDEDVSKNLEEDSQEESENNEQGVEEETNSLDSENDENASSNNDDIDTNIENITENSSSISEMELDIENLKAYSFIKPVEFLSITSAFGMRVSENPNVDGYHTGTDFAAELGTPIVASMQGIVENISEEGDYGKHFSIRCNNVTTLYAHCSSIYVEEGQIVSQGQLVAAVGSTGNSTGPHLHFEIRIDDRFVDPEKVIVF